MRDARHLSAGLRKIEKFGKIKLKIGGSLKNNPKLIAALDVRNMLPTCEMILKAAALRTESRGAHYRSDYPKLSKKWEQNIILSVDARGNLKFSRKAVSQPSTMVRKKIKWKKKQEEKVHLLE